MKLAKTNFNIVKMRYKPERALTPGENKTDLTNCTVVEMRYKPERALTPHGSFERISDTTCRNEV